jgi:hypothetical protein
MSTNGGTSYDTGSNYSWSSWSFTPPGTGLAGTNADTQIALLNGYVTTSNFATSGTYRLYDPANTSIYKLMAGAGFVITGTSRNSQGQSFAGTYLSTSAVNAFRVKATSGNIASGTVRIYGIAK